MMIMIMMLRKVNQEKQNGGSTVELRSLWRPEYASYMVSVSVLIIVVLIISSKTSVCYLGKLFCKQKKR